MVRAAASGTFNYAGSDPLDKNWRLRHRLFLQEISRQEEQKLFDSVHEHWCAYLSNGNLTPDGFNAAKKGADETLNNLRQVIYPWIEPPSTAVTTQASGSTIDPETQRLIDKYKALVNKPAKPGE
jgi:hypothetical protein